MGRGQVLDAALRNRHRYLWEDPVRFACMACALMLTFLPILPFLVTFFVILVVQMSAVALVARFSEPGWSWQWGKRLHSGILASSMCLDWTNLSACTIVGAMLLMRQFDAGVSMMPLCILTLGVCLLPDARLCRLLLSSDPSKRADHLREGYFWRDPVKLGTMLSLGVVCWIDPNTLNYLLLSIVFLQFNSLMVFVDKYLAELEITRPRGLSSIVWEQEGRRMLICLSPLALVPLRNFGGDKIAYMAAVMVAGLLVIPDLIRFAMEMAANFWGWAFKPRPRPYAPPTTIIGVLKG